MGGGSDDFFSRFLGPHARDSPNNKNVRSDELLKPDLWENPAPVLSISFFSSRRRRLFSAMSLILEKISLRRGLEEEMAFLASPRMEKEKEEEGRGEGYKSAREKSLGYEYRARGEKGECCNMPGREECRNILWDGGK